MPQCLSANLDPAAELQLSLAHGFSPGEGIAAIETIAHEHLPPGFGFHWTEIALQEKPADNTAFIAFGLAVVFVFFLLAGLYESWLLPLAVILIVPMCVLAAMIGVTYRGLDRNILVEIGLVVLVGLAAKSAILIVEFAKQGEEHGKTRYEADVSKRASSNILLWLSLNIPAVLCRNLCGEIGIPVESSAQKRERLLRFEEAPQALGGGGSARLVRVAGQRVLSV